MIKWIIKKIQGIERVEIRCRFDNTMLGTLDVDKSKWEKRHKAVDISDPASHGIIDTRCDSCGLNFGNYKKMKKDFIGAGGTEQQFEKHMKKNDYKNTNLGDALLNLYEHKDPDLPRIVIQ